MITLPEYPIIPNRLPADKCVIITRVRLKDVVGESSPDKLDTLPEELRAPVHHKKGNAKAESDTVFTLKSPKKYKPPFPPA